MNKYLKRTLITILAGAGLTLGAKGCKNLVNSLEQESKARGDFYRETQVEDYNVSASVDGNGRILAIQGEENSYLSARDYENDGRFDDVRIKAPKGSPLEKFANLDKLERIYSEAARK